MKIEINNLCKSYGNKEVLKNVDLQINEGMFGLLGPNGAGKTTLMRVLTTLINKNSGDAKINGIDIANKDKIRGIVGYLPQDFSMYPSMKVYEAMDYIAVLCEINNKNERKTIIEDLLCKVNLENNMKTKIKVLSGGMRRRLGIAQAMINNPKVLIIDEPTVGLDPEERVRFRNMLRDFSDEKIVILSTHIVEDIEFTCENMAVLKSGKIVYKGKVNEFIKDANGHVWSILVKKNQLEEIKDKYNIISTVADGDKYRVKFIADSKPFENAVIITPNMEDAYMKVVKEA
ncbi:ABC-2 type transport system ATP-binding protein [Clostridium cavendishii DSM 21758]|uniref:ABC-2 type transport system ATP-binding protein n=1 Tax=Clostridium cavendishii DSM 21758 TaxID=1121302 RepID=A0A1M6SHW7_9CLOT|nr:ABC transporter ATP-binding protein [Clostridium cavendishii]SHK44352.1 ABC-2 type transport system ATP-binding protein [Clostridium cavendishii DSM 21758]